MTGRYAAYQQYADAEIEWADFLPAAWDGVKLRWTAHIYAGGTPSKTNASYWENGSIPWLNSGTVNQGTICEASARITDAALANSSARWIKSGSLVVALAGQGKTKGMVAQLGIDATCNQSMAAIVPSPKLRPRFLFWWLSSNYQNVRNMAGGDLRDGLNLELLGDIECPLPAIEEQDRIAKFLDYETARIDALIEKQQQLIALLKEKRQAVISHAVTKGLNPDVPMRDSGVEWLGAVPVHWEVARLKHLTHSATSGPYGSSLTKAMYSQDGIRVYGQQQAIAGDFTIGDYYISERKFAEMTRYEVFPGDVLVTVMGTIGRVVVVPADVERGIINPRLVRYKADMTRVLPAFLRLSLLGDLSQARLKLMAQGSTMEGLNMQILGDLPVPYPPLNEQTEILAESNRVCGKLDELIESSSRAADLLQERRTALISAAVTGKIDVRGWKPEQSKPYPEATL